MRRVRRVRRTLSQPPLQQRGDTARLRQCGDGEGGADGGPDGRIRSCPYCRRPILARPKQRHELLTKRTDVEAIAGGNRVPGGTGQQPSVFQHRDRRLRRLRIDPEPCPAGGNDPHQRPLRIQDRPRHWSAGRVGREVGPTPVRLRAPSRPLDGIVAPARNGNKRERVGTVPGRTITHGAPVHEQAAVAKTGEPERELPRHPPPATRIDQALRAVASRGPRRRALRTDPPPPGVPDRMVREPHSRHLLELIRRNARRRLEPRRLLISQRGGPTVRHPRGRRHRHTLLLLDEAERAGHLVHRRPIGGRHLLQPRVERLIRQRPHPKRQHPHLIGNRRRRGHAAAASPSWFLRRRAWWFRSC